MRNSLIMSLVGAASVAAALLVGCGDNDVKPVSSKQGESCVRTADCVDGLVCVANVCYATVPTGTGGEAGQAGVVGGHEGFGLGCARSLGVGQCSLRHREDFGRVKTVAVAPLVATRIAPVAHHLPTPIWTSRKRAPEQAWPTLAPWPGSPLPQFGVPSIT